ncbi:MULTISPECIES: hypothetical protein [unclassified Cupriavidus]|uniref:hypothetical protein n=1 Tax=unclassified Cupriavidus TaxID=2640874 RepID=UPI001C004EBC|nr:MULTISPECIES: hypothetical protein [unclassified Cupriavidus]MCA3187535.1 hypothetical protein [Cupriavidus sp.]MCA3191162.1 hypothetical protein [Cupriavidus sp.]MCA3200226.1 hypothetical protein [Cupriavidus sp.]MCA3205427.1 hypothetical protein [Cupriavidus sp.]MCA3208274.1 hypothetical protein [Cupriavidus sp.]
MNTSQAVARQADHENLKHLRPDTVDLLQDVLQRMDVIDLKDPSAIGKLTADAKYALICMRIELGTTQ